jgi:hypothetical protein
MAEDLIELIAPHGTDEANHGTERYRVDNNGRIRVPREAAFHLIRAGFKIVPLPDPPRDPPPDPDPAPKGAFLMPEPTAAPARKVPRSPR